MTLPRRPQKSVDHSQAAAQQDRAQEPVGTDRRRHPQSRCQRLPSRGCS